MTILDILAATLALLFIARTGESIGTDRCDGLASYQLVLQTFWSRETFHRQYPTYRPNAQWSRLIGRSHSDRYSLWSVGKMATEALKEFAEQGLSTILDVEAQGSRGVFDSFVGSNIPTGVGSSTVKFLAHSKYHKLSFIVRIIPSPDWFVGVDSLDLCTNGQWVTETKLDLHPMDSGTDRGFAFTSPNWAEDPQKPIFAMTSRFPNHPASSFYYPELASLPPIAQMTLTKINFTWIEDLNEPPYSKTKGSTGKGNDGEPLIDTKSNAKELLPRDDGKAAAAPSVVARSFFGTDVDNATKDSGRTIHTSIEKSVIRKTYSSGLRGTKQMRNGRSRLPVDSADRVDCQVTDWDDWGSCSKTCGFGVRVRTRSVISRARGGGRPCPLLREEQLCGSMATCNWQYFSRSNRPDV